MLRRQRAAGRKPRQTHRVRYLKTTRSWSAFLMGSTLAGGVETKAEPKRRGRPPKSSKKTSETSTSVEQGTASHKDCASAISDSRSGLDAGTPVAKSKRSRSKRVVVDESEEEDHVAESKPTKQKAPPRASANAKKAVAKPKAKPSKTSAMPVIPEETEEGAQSDDELAVKAVTKNPRSRSKGALSSYFTH